jgi:hypothetical protein
VIVDFYKMETFHFNITCQLIPLFAVNERKKESKFCPLYHFSIVSSEYFFFEHFSVRVVGTFQRTECTVLYIITTAARCVLPPPEHTPHSDVDCTSTNS